MILLTKCLSRLHHLFLWTQIPSNPRSGLKERVQLTGLSGGY